MKLPWSSDDKTKVVESLRKRDSGGDGATDRETVVVRKSSEVGSEKTLPIESYPPGAETANSDARGKLSWPARDSAGARRGPGKPDQELSRPTPRDEQTRLYVPSASAAGSEPAATAGENSRASVAKVNEDPVVGWLVIIEGPGKGRSFELGFGANSIGRDKSQKVALDFGDAHISREKHALLVHDPKSMRFFLQTGDVRNLTYLGEEVVLTPVQLMGREVIVMGGTKLMFVPFCGPEFGWS